MLYIPLPPFICMFTPEKAEGRLTGFTRVSYDMSVFEKPFYQMEDKHVRLSYEK